jgi:hypothetical protein
MFVVNILQPRKCLLEDNSDFSLADAGEAICYVFTVGP